MFKLEFDFDKLTAKLDRFGEVVEGAIRPAAQAGAQVFYDEVKLRASRIKNSGRLAKSIYQRYMKEVSVAGVNARYHISWNKGGTKGTQTQPAFHGQLIEYGWVQRYATYLDKKGNWWTAVRPEMRGKPRPKARASQAVKDAYYVLRKGGPIQHPPRSFLRASFEAKQQAALEAVNKEMQERILKAFT